MKLDEREELNLKKLAIIRALISDLEKELKKV